MCILFHRESEGSGQSKISYFEGHFLAVHQEIVRLKIPVIKTQEKK